MRRADKDHSNVMKMFSLRMTGLPHWKRLCENVIVIVTGIIACMAATSHAAVVSGPELSAINIAADYQSIFHVDPLSSVGDTVWITAPVRYSSKGITVIFPYTVAPDDRESRSRVYLENKNGEGVVLQVYDGAKITVEVGEGYGIPYMEINANNPISNVYAPSSGKLGFMEKDGSSWWRSWTDNAAPEFVSFKGNSSTWFKGFYVRRVDMEEYVPAPAFSMLGGNVSDPFMLTLSFDVAAPTGSAIYYTLDGSIPSESETRILYNAPFQIATTTVVKAQGYNEDSDYWSEMTEAKYTFPAVVSGFDEIVSGCDPKSSVILKGEFTVIENYIYASTASNKVNNLILRDKNGKIGVVKLPNNTAITDQARMLKAGDVVNGEMRGTYTLIQNRHAQIELAGNPEIVVSGNHTLIPEIVETDDISSYLADLDNDGKLICFIAHRNVTPVPFNYYTSLYSSDVKINPWTKNASQYYGAVKVTGIVFPQIDSKGIVKPQIVLWGGEECATAILDYKEQSWFKNSSGAIGNCRISLCRPAKAGVWTAIAVPFKWSYDELFRIYGSDTKVAEFVRNSNQGSENKVRFAYKVDPTGDIPNATPLLIMPSRDVEGFVEVSAVSMNGAGTSTVLGGATAAASDVVFASHVNYDSQSSSFNPGSSYSRLSKWFVIGENGIFHPVNPSDAMDGMAAVILASPNVLDSEGNLTFIVGEEEIKVGVDSVANDEIKGSGIYYDLAGRPMGTDKTVLTPGIYIRDNMKIVVNRR